VEPAARGGPESAAADTNAILIYYFTGSAVAGVITGEGGGSRDNLVVIAIAYPPGVPWPPEKNIVPSPGASFESLAEWAKDGNGDRAVIVNIAPSPVVVKEEKNVEVAAPGEVFVVVFSSNRANFSGLDPGRAARNQAVLAQVAQLLGENPSARVLIEGFANPVLHPRNEEAILRRLKKSGPPTSRRPSPLSVFPLTV
jgi:hypothetical protein